MSKDMTELLEKAANDTLTYDEALYLAQRDALPDGYENPLKPAQPGSINDVVHTGDANTAGITMEQLEARLERAVEEQDEGAEKVIKEFQKALRRQKQLQEGGDEDDEESYADMKSKVLRAEIARRNEDRADEDKIEVPEGAKKPDLVALLEADDEGDTEE